MHRSKHLTSRKLKKEVEKEVRKGQIALSLPNSEALSVEAHSRERRSRFEELHRASGKKAHLKGGRGHVHLSKRTTPGEVDQATAAPHIVHVEGGRWKHTVDRQSLLRARSLDKKLSKTRSNGRKK